MRDFIFNQCKKKVINIQKLTCQKKGERPQIERMKGEWSKRND